MLATDLQGFSATLANSILLRTSPGNADSVWRRWTNDAFKNGEFDDYSAAFLKFELFNWDQDPVRAVSCARDVLVRRPASNTCIRRALF